MPAASKVPHTQLMIVLTCLQPAEYPVIETGVEKCVLVVGGMEVSNK